MHTISEVYFPDKKKIYIVLDNFATHNPSKFYEHFSPEVANKLVKKFEFHYTPKHASWLNMAEIEFSALLRQALDKRIEPSEQSLSQRSCSRWVPQSFSI